MNAYAEMVATRLARMRAYLSLWESLYAEAVEEYLAERAAEEAAHGTWENEGGACP